MTDQLSKTDAQQRSDQIRAFQHELVELEQSGVLLLFDEQRQRIEKCHQALLADYRAAFDVDSSHQEKQLSLGMRVASFLGAVALAASLFFLFYQFWGRFDTRGQVLILASASIITFLITVFVASRDSSGYFTKLAGLVSFSAFVLNISMFGQIFNITPTDNALLVWAAFALILAYSYDVRLLLVAAILCLIAFVAARVGAWSGVYWIHFGERPENFIPVALLLFFLPQWLDHKRFSGFALAYRVCGALALFIPMLILSYWGDASYLNFAPDLIEGGYQLLGFTLSAALVWLGIRKGWGDAVNTGVTFFALFLYTKFFDWWWQAMPKYLFFLVIGLVAILCLVVLKRLRNTQPPVTGGRP